MAKISKELAIILIVINLYIVQSNSKRLIDNNPNIIAMCSRLPSFLRKNTILRRCSNTQASMSILYNASRLATRECQYQFRLRPWNCSSAPESLTKIVNHAFQETAYLFAIHSAGLAYSLAYACSRGLVKDCLCQEEPKEKVIPKSKLIVLDKQCSKESISYGIKKSRYLLKNVKERDTRSLVDEHNKEAGRLALNATLNKDDGLDCHCHGVSGACTVQKCVVRLPKIRVISSYLLSKYVSAIKVGTDNNGKKLISSEATVVEPTNKDLVFTERSPDFCKKNLLKGSLGTKGRHCIKDAPIGSSSSCKILCCNRGFKTVVRVVNEPCNCTFTYCCNVTCKRCPRTITTHICN